MKDKLTIISDDLNHNIITELEAKKQLLILLGVSIMKTNEEIVKIIEEKLGDVEYENIQTGMAEEYYIKNDAKIQVLEELLRFMR